MVHIRATSIHLTFRSLAMKGVSLQVSANTVLRGIFTCLLVVTVACSSDLVDTAESKKGTRDKSEGSIASMSQ